jgi:3-isopropylmalate dehydrogenase
MFSDLSTYDIAVLPGDGIGPEVVEATVSVLQALTPLYNLKLNYTRYDFGAGAYKRTGRKITAADMDQVGTSHAVLFGAMGLPDVRMPDGTECGPQIDMRHHFGLFASLRQARLYDGVPSRVSVSSDSTVDMLVIRETTEGMFAGLKDPYQPSDEEMSDRMTITRKTSEKLFRVAFTQARLRRKFRGTPGHVTLLHKSNALRSSVLLVKVFREIAAEFPDISNAEHYIDAGAMYFVTAPERYDVVVTENIFGDIVSEVAAGVVGGLGVAPSGDVSDNMGIFQPSHGSAPDIAGQGIANPIATFLSAAMMLEWLGDQHQDQKCVDAALTLQRAVERQLQHGPKTPDIGGQASTEDVTRDLIRSLRVLQPQDIAISQTLPRSYALGETAAVVC